MYFICHSAEWTPHRNVCNITALIKDCFQQRNLITSHTLWFNISVNILWNIRSLQDLWVTIFPHKYSQKHEYCNHQHNKMTKLSQTWFIHKKSVKILKNTKRSLYQHEITSEKCSDSHLQSYRNQGDVLNFLSQQSEYWPIKWVEIIHCRAKAWPGLVFYARIIVDWITQKEIANMFSWNSEKKPALQNMKGIPIWKYYRNVNIFI